MPIIQIDAFDTLFFRDGKPFSMGDDTWANGIFPPNPSVFYGAVRTLYFSEHIEDFSNANSDNDPTQSLQIKGIYYSIDDKPYFILPADLVKEKEDNKSILLEEVDKNDFIDSSIFSKSLQPTSLKQIEAIDAGIMNMTGMNDYLQKAKSSSYSELQDYISIESKIGIARNHISKTSEDGKLYRVNLTRLEATDKPKLKFFVEYGGLDLKSEGFLKLGGEGKMASYKRMDNMEFPLKAANSKSEIFKLYFLSPTFFEKGSLPKWINSNTLEGMFQNLHLKLENAVVGNFLSIGGFDMKEKKAKPMRRAVPPGSIYYFRLLSGTMEDVIQTFHYKSISEFETSKEGYGIVLVGVRS